MTRTIVALIVLIVSSGTGFAQAPPNERIDTKTGTVRVVRVDRPFTSSYVGNPDMLEVVPLSNRELLLRAKDRVGNTNLVLLNNANETTYSADIVVTAVPFYPRPVQFHTLRELNDYFVYTCTPDNCVRLKQEFPGEHSNDIFVPGLIPAPQQNISVTSPPPSGGGK
jgi:hypothetical protein